MPREPVLPWNGRSICFPPWSDRLRISPRPAKAIHNGLNLFDTYHPFRSATVNFARAFVGLGGHRLWRWLDSTSMSNAAWWSEFHVSVVEPIVGKIGSAAVARRYDRVDALLMGNDGAAKAFAKVLSTQEDVDRMRREGHVLQLILAARPANFRVPAILTEGTLHGLHYWLFEPLPDGPHWRPPPDPVLIAGVIDELQDCLQDLGKPPNALGHHVPAHGDFTHRNLRLCTDGGLWLFDWEYCDWMPLLADELRYWTCHYAYRTIPRPRAAARDILNILNQRGTTDDICEAVAWPEYNRQSEAAIRGEIWKLLAGRAVN